MLDVFITIAVGLFLALIGLFMTSFAVGMRETLSRSSKDHDTLGKLVFFVWVLVGFWALTIIALCVAWSVWFAIVLLPSVLIGLSVFTIEEDVSAVHETTDPAPDLGTPEQSADAIGSHSTAATLPSSQLPGNANSEEHTQWLHGYDALERGKELYVRKQFQQALEQFDQAIESGLTEADVYGLRGSCLQMLDFHFDAIDDFTEALATETDNCNLYYSRSQSRGAIGDFRGEVADLHEAIRLAEVLSRQNDVWDEHAQEQSLPRRVEAYTMSLMLANMQLETQERDERRRKEHPDVSTTDLAARNRAKCKRRPGRQGRA
ncbi:MAG: tetratricopeptide repeat protein [Planctomycetes bacterium]|nr:tetratricopeptide repeat protein [Planctomycetota bacterium]